MKKLYASFSILFFLIGTLNAQLIVNSSYGKMTTDDFAPIGAEWYYSSSGNGLAPPRSEYYHLLAVKDTTINGLNLRIIERTYYPYQGGFRRISPYYIYQSGDTVSLYDPEINKLYRLFVFNATKGDTLTFDIPYDNYYLEDTTYRVVIDTIVTETYNGTELEKYVLEQIDEFGWFNSFYLEKVGGYEWFLPLGKAIIPEADGPLRCYHDSIVDVKISAIDCDYRITNSFNNQLANSISLSPNPTSDIVQIRTNLTIDYFEIMNITGKIILQTTNPLINLESFENGIYFIKINFDNNSIVMKVIKY